MRNYKIFYNQAVLSITRLEQCNETEKQNKNCFIFDDFFNLERMITDFLTNEISVSLLYSNSYEETTIWSKMKFFFVFQQAAGGLVIKNNSILSIFRYGCWDFPKGHIEARETDENAAIREVTEETGIDELFITNDLGFTYHLFSCENHFVLKVTHWYEMHTPSNKIPMPQTDESILQAEWIPLKNIDIILQNTYPALVEMIEKIQTVNHDKKK